MNTQQLWNKLHAHDSQGVRCLAFSPNNKMIASGGIDNLVIWSLQDSCQVVKHYQRDQPSKCTVSELNWSHDGMLLAAAIHDYIAVFDVRKFGQPVSKQQLLRPT